MTLIPKTGNIRVIDGTSDERAPRPRRSGWARAIYDVVHANTGWNSISQIQELLPAAMTTEQLIPLEDVRKYALKTVYQGYLIERDGKFAIAPKSYYESRRAFLKESMDAHRSGKRRSLPTRTPTRPK